MGFHYPIIDMDASGMHLKNVCTEAGYTPQQLRHLLELSAPQAICQWYRGRSLPSTDNLFALSKLLEKHMDELIVEQSFGEETERETQGDENQSTVIILRNKLK